DGEKGLRDLEHGGVDGAGLQSHVKHVARAQGQKRDLVSWNLIGRKICRARISARVPNAVIPSFLPRICWMFAMLGAAIRSKDGLSVKAKTTLTSMPFTAAATAVPVAVPKSMPPANIAGMV